MLKLMVWLYYPAQYSYCKSALLSETSEKGTILPRLDLGGDSGEKEIGLSCLTNFRFFTYSFSGLQSTLLNFFLLPGLLTDLMLNLSLNLLLGSLQKLFH